MSGKDTKNLWQHIFIRHKPSMQKSQKMEFLEQKKNPLNVSAKCYFILE